MGTRYFAYQYKVLGKREVEENKGGRLTFRVKFPQVDELMAESREELRLEFPEDPILNLVLQTADKLLEYFPWYIPVRNAMKRLKKIDPGFKESLGFLKSQFEKYGLIDPPEVIEFVARLRSLAGSDLRINYYRGFGITSIKVLGGEKLKKTVLMQFARNSSLLMDYYIAPGLGSKEPGTEWVVDAKTVSGIINTTSDVSVEGNLKVRRGKNDPVRKLARLDLVGGSVELTIPDNGGEQSSTITPITGSYLQFSDKDKIIVEGRLKWRMSQLRIGSDHLLFGLEEIQNLVVESYYEAKRVK
jgi:hypothetical protein